MLKKPRVINVLLGKFPKRRNREKFLLIQGSKIVESAIFREF